MQALERLVGEFVLGPELDPGDTASVEGFLSRHGLPEGDAAAVRAELGRLRVYRTLVRTRLREAIELFMPRSVARLGPLFDETFDRFLAERGPRSHYLRDVTPEFLEFCGPWFASDPRFPRWAHDLARHEALDVFVGSLSARGPRDGASELDADRAVVFSEAVRLVRYDFAVHRLSSDPADRTEPERLPTALLVYRDESHDVRYLELSELAAAILERLLAGATLRGAVEGAAASQGVALDSTLLEGAAEVLSDLGERGVLLGASDRGIEGVGLRKAAASAETERR